MDPFSDPQVVANYADGPARIVPGYDEMLRMATLLLAERVPKEGRVLVLGAGGGLEIKAFALAHPGWTFDGVDPSNEMLQLAKQILGPLASRTTLHQGHITVAPPGPFDAATCLLTFHFLPLEERRQALVEARRRLKPGAPFVVVHLSIPQRAEGRELWFSRYSAFAASSSITPEQAANTRAAMEARLTILTPEQDEMLLHEAGFCDVSLFYAGFTFRGWVAYA